MERGAQVEVRSRFDGRWVTGFEVVRLAIGQDGSDVVWVARRSDGCALPVPFALDDVRPRGSNALNALQSRSRTA